ncbi:peptidase S66 [Kordiimonas sediminis]|uniref:Peptidase S66 n=2 Tax=Kordiimonas sediminis TaxID=1735581 RepID=A0A919E6N7_9PROT|nr:peptidase S66 [Kordiimonas sediminis]
MLASGVSLASLGYIQPGDAVASGAGGVKPARLRVGDTVRLVAPAGVIYEKVRIDIALESLTALGLKPTLGNHVYDRHGYFAGRDADRAADINAAFADPSVKAVFALSGGWGAARTLPYLDFDLIKENPKVIIGYSDITALLNAIYAKTGLTTFHGPNATTRWTDFNVQSFQDMVMKGTTPELVNPQVRDNSLAVRTNRIQTINAGTAEGALVGGNLTVLTALAGTPYLPDFKGKILFLEDVGEAIYRVDRMLSTLELAGVFKKVTGIVFGGFTKVGNDGAGFGSFALMDIFEQYGKQHGKPCFYGAMFGHVENARTIPIGGTARIDADKGSIHLLVPAVR